MGYKQKLLLWCAYFDDDLSYSFLQLTSGGVAFFISSVHHNQSNEFLISASNFDSEINNFRISFCKKNQLIHYFSRHILTVRKIPTCDINTPGNIKSSPLL